MKESFDKKFEILVPIPDEYMRLLTNIENLAINEGLKLPVEFQTNVGHEEVFKRLPIRANLYIKVNHDVACFDKNCKPIKMEAMTTGDYRVVIHVKGLYIGTHSNGKLVSLQLRICQIQNLSKVPVCMFTCVPSWPMSGSQKRQMVSTNISMPVPETPQPGVEAAPLNVPTKKGRKPKLQRQNAVVESRIQQEEHRQMETLPPDFFHDIDLNTLANN